MIDRYTRWPEAVPVEEISAESVCKVLYEVWVSRYGVPHKVTTDQGRQFESDLFRGLSKLLGMTRVRTTPYHPQSNGCVERWHRSLKSALTAHLGTMTWTSVLPTVLLGLRSTVRLDAGHSAAEVVFGQALRLPGEFVEPTVKQESTTEVLRRLHATLKSLSPANFRAASRPIFKPKDLDTCDYIFLRDDAVRRPLVPPYTGPHKVVKRGKKTCQIQLPGRKLTVSWNRIKPAYRLITEDDPISAGAEQGIVQSRPAHQHPEQVQEYKTRSGRQVKRNIRFLDIIGGSIVGNQVSVK